MFSGIIEKMGQVKALKARAQGMDLQIHFSGLKRRLRLGDSIAVNGCCLTVTRMGKRFFGRLLPMRHWPRPI